MLEVRTCYLLMLVRSAAVITGYRVARPGHVLLASRAVWPLYMSDVSAACLHDQLAGRRLRSRQEDWPTGAEGRAPARWLLAGRQHAIDASRAGRGRDREIAGSWRWARPHPHGSSALQPALPGGLLHAYVRLFQRLLVSYEIHACAMAHVLKIVMKSLDRAIRLLRT